ncbi:MAG TPA: hypothetical protein VI583_01100 [Cyclobacteriaceae bacterium]|nr:hypothetical protein [Cyclobacteriaceae bacterium]
MKDLKISGSLSFLLCCSIYVNAQQAINGRESVTTIIVDATKSIGTIEPIWNSLGGNLGLALTPQGDRLLQKIAESSPYPYYRRCWGLTNSGTPRSSGGGINYGAANIYHVDENGRPYYDFTLFDHLIDGVVSKGFIPIMLLGSMPDSLSSAPLATAEGRDNIQKYPPRDYIEWYNLVNQIVKHCIERYSKENVTAWKWELWNEPDLKEYWMGTEEEYFKLYDYTASAIKDALPETMIGGNTVTQSLRRGTPFLTKFVEHCLHGKNFKTGKTGTPLDFISFHLKGTSFDIKRLGNFSAGKIPENIPRFSPSLDFILECAENNLKAIASIPGTSGIPVYVTECDIDIGLTVSTYENPSVEYRNTEYHPVFQCALTKEIFDISSRYPDNPIRTITFDGLYYPGYRIFEGQRALFTAEEIEKPVFNAFRLLGKLGTERLEFFSSGNDNIDGLASRNGDKIQVMVYNFNQDVNDRNTHNVELSVTVPVSGPYKLTHYRIDENHSNAYSIWKSLGKPFVPDISQMKKIRSKQGLELYEPVKVISPVSPGNPDNPDNPVIKVLLDMPHHSVSLLIFEPAK